jgi:hypothetical protein
MIPPLHLHDPLFRVGGLPVAKPETFEAQNQSKTLHFCNYIKAGTEASAEDRSPSYIDTFF